MACTTDIATPLRIGLTGGIASGKSTVARLFADHGASVISADAIAHDLLAPGTPETAAVIAAFGPQVLDSKGEIDRSALRDRVFDESEARRRLEAVLHPPILKELADAAMTATGPYAVLEIPLLVETGLIDAIDRVLVVDCPEALQIERLGQRDGMSVADSRRILAAQAPRTQRVEAADDIIVNDSDLASLQSTVSQLHAFYLRLAQRRRKPVC